MISVFEDTNLCAIHAKRVRCMAWVLPMVPLIGPFGRGDYRKNGHGLTWLSEVDTFNGVSIGIVEEISIIKLPLRANVSCLTVRANPNFSISMGHPSLWRCLRASRAHLRLWWHGILTLRCAMCMPYSMASVGAQLWKYDCHRFQIWQAHVCA